MKNINKIRIATIIGGILLSAVVNIAFGQPPNQADVRELSPNQTVEREITGTETHRYKFDLKANEFFQVRVEQKGVDVILILGNNENVLATMNSPNGKEGPEILTFVPIKDGIYKLEISGSDDKAEKGIYTIKRENSRAATVADKRRVEVEKLLIEAIIIPAKIENSREVIDKLEIVLKGWRELNEEYQIQLISQFINQIKHFVNKRVDVIAEEAQKLFNQNTPESLSKSKEKFEQSSSLCQTTSNYKCLIVSTLQLARIAEFFNDSAEALRKYEQILRLLPNEKNDEMEALSLNNIGIIYLNNLKDNQKAIEYFEKSLAICRKSNLANAEIVVLNNLGEYYERLKESGKAIEYYKQSLTLNQNIDQKWKIDALSNLADLYSDLGKMEQSFEYRKQLLTVAEVASDTDLKVLTLVKLGIASIYLGNYQTSAEYIAQAELLLPAVKDKSKKALALNFISLIYFRLGKTQEALNFSEKSLEIIASTENKEGEALALTISGGALAYLGDLPKGQENLKKALKISTGNGDKPNEALALNLLSGIALNQGKKQEAQKYSNQALSIAKEIGNKNLQAESLNILGLIDIGSGDYSKALETLQQALLISEEIGDKTNQSLALNFTAIAYISLGKLRDSLENSQQGATIAQNSGDKRNHSLGLIFSGIALEKLGDTQKAIDSLQQALAIGTEIGDKRNISIALVYLGSLNYKIGEQKKAQQFLEQSLAVASEINDKNSQSLALNFLGEIFLYSGERNKAISYLDRALAIANEIDDKNNQGKALISLAGAFGANNAAKALQYLNEAKKIAEDTKDKSNLAKTLIGLGAVYFLTGELRKTLDYADRVLPIVEESGDKTLELARLYILGIAYSALGQQDEALKYFDKSLVLSKEIKSKEAESLALGGLAKVYLLLDKTSEAENYANESLKISRESKFKTSEVAALSVLGYLYLSASKTDAALEVFNQCLEIAEIIEDNSVKTVSLNNIGFLYLKSKENRKALEYFDKASFVKADYKGNKALLLSNKMVVWDFLEKPNSAILFGKQSVNTFQELRTNLQGANTDLQKSFLTSVEEVYRFLANLLIKQGRLSETQQVLNSFKDQQFFDFNQTQIKQPAPLALTPREKEFFDRYEKTSSEVGAVGNRLEELKRQIGSRQPTADETAQLQKFEGDLKRATDAFFTVLKQAEIEFSKPKDEKDKVGEIPGMRDMQTALREISANTKQKAAAVYQLVGEENFHLLVITADEIKKVSTPVKNSVVNQKALDFWALLQSPVYDPNLVGKELYDVVFKPVESVLPEKTETILWALDGNLRYVPMAALFDGEQYLVERYNHVNFTRADKERMTRAVKPVWTAVGLGTSEAKTVELLGNKISFNALPGVGEELKMLFRQKDGKGGIFDGETLSDATFNKKNMLDVLKQKRPLVHIASHFSFRPGDEARSFLLLGDGSPLTLAEMKAETNLFQGVELLTLSACNTAAQQSGANGREVDGFAELAQRLGANSVMATLWAVADCSTPWLMREFYDSKLNKNKNKAESLREAQLSLISGKAAIKSCPTRTDLSPIKIVIVKTPEDKKRKIDGTRNTDIFYLDEKDAPEFVVDKAKPFAHPYYWSPFILFGNWK